MKTRSYHSLISAVLFSPFLACTSVPVQTKAVRDYQEVERRILALKGVQKEVIGTIESPHPNMPNKYPLYLLTLPASLKSDPAKVLNVVLSGGAHGDEPAGVYALLEWIEKYSPTYSDRFRFYIFPCLNPVGFENNTAENSRGENINRMYFEGTKNPEAVFIMKSLKEKKVRFIFTMDMHEIPPYWEGEGWTTTDNPKTAYLYETQANRSRRIGRKMIGNLPSGTEVCDWPSIYGDKAEKGVVSYPEGNGNKVYAEGTTFDSYLFRGYTEHSFTTETPIDWPLEKRVRTHISWLNTALQEVSNIRIN